MNCNEQISEIRKRIQNKEYNVAEGELLELINRANTKEIEDENNTHYSFNNYIETLLFWNLYKPQKKNIDPDVNYAEVYYYLGFINVKQKNYGKAIEYLEQGLQWNPIDVTLIIERATIYRMLGETEKFKAEIEKTHSLIYRSFDMARYYAELGWYYVEKRVFDLANALYTYSISYENTQLARNGLMYIAKQQDREARISTNEEIKKLLMDYNISRGFNKSTVNLIYEEYQRLQKYKPQPTVVRFLSQRLYDMTLDKKFMTYYNLKDEKLGVRDEKTSTIKQDNEKLIEYIQEIPGYPVFKFHFPDSMGEYIKYSANVFELKKNNIQKIRVMISKCNSEENLEEDAKKWIEKNKRDAQMEDVSYRKEKIKNIPIEVYELRKIETNGIRIYKIGYVNGCRITISGGKTEGKEEIINTAFEKLTWVEATASKKESFFENLENSLKTAYTDYENNKIAEVGKEIEKILDELLKDDKKVQENMISKIFVYDVFKAIIFNSFYHKIQLTNNDLDSLLADKELVKKNIIEFCENFKEQKDIISQAESLNDNMLKSINDKMIEDVLHTIMINIGKKNIKITIKPVDKKPVENKPIIVNCPACNTNFELKWNVPATEKTFYCKCPNCGMELKRGNPNYKGNEKVSDNKDKIITYLINTLKQTEKRAITSFDYLNQHEDIANEFASCIDGNQFNYCDNGIVVEGYTAKSLKEEVGEKLSDLGVYNYLVYLRNNPDEAKRNLAAGLPRK